VTRPVRLLSLDGGVAAIATLVGLNPGRTDLPPTAAQAGMIARGAGLSYAAASFAAGATVVETAARNRVLDFDPASGVVTVEAGITLGDLHRHLGPLGHYLPIQPGYGGISVGGCIAADVHGKNPARDGTFVRQVEALTLFHPDHGIVELSDTAHPDILALTCGGFGLTGIILTARLRTQRLPGAWVCSIMLPTANAAETADLLGRHALSEDFAYAWMNLLRTGPGFGGGFVTAIRFGGDPTQPGAVDLSFPPGRLTPDRRARLPFSLMRRPTIMAMNAVYTLMANRKGDRRTEPLGKALFTFNGNEIYHELFGRPGFHEAQVIVPHAAFPAFMEAIRSHTRRHDAPIALGAGKLFAGSARMLRFDGDGICVAVNLRRNRNAAAFLAALDQDVIRLGGRPNLIKDSRLPRAVFEATCPEADAFRRRLRDWDPKRRFRSELSERLGL